MTKSDKVLPQAAALSLWPTYALRAWLTALLVQTQQAETALKYRIEDGERDLERMRDQAKRSTQVVKSLQSAIDKVDDLLRRRRDAELAKAGEPAPRARPEPAPPEPKTKK